MDQNLLNQILATLTNVHGTTLYDMVLQTLRSHDVRHSHHRASILDRMPDLFNLLSEQSPQQLEAAVTTTAAATYQNEVQNLIQPQTGFHFTGNRTCRRNCNNVTSLQDFTDNFNLPYTWTSPHSLLHFPLYLLITLWHHMLDWPRLNWHFRVCSGQIFKKKSISDTTLGCSSAPRTKQHQAATSSFGSRYRKLSKN
jgi:hypothetical protein